MTNSMGRFIQCFKDLTFEGIYTLVDGREVDVGVDWDEPLDVRTRAVRRALKRKLGVEHFERSGLYPLQSVLLVHTVEVARMVRELLDTSLAMIC